MPVAMGYDGQGPLALWLWDIIIWFGRLWGIVLLRTQEAVQYKLGTEKAVEISARCSSFGLAHNFISEQSFTSKQPCRPKSAPTAAIQQYPPSRVATTSSRITLRLSQADSTTETTEAEADNDKVSS